MEAVEEFDAALLRDAGRAEEDDGEAAFDDGERAVEKVGRRETLGDDVARLHQLERELVRIAVVHPASDDDAVFHERISLDEILNLRFQLESLGRVGGNYAEVEFVCGEFISQHVEMQHLARVGLGRGDRAFAARVDEHRLVGDRRHRRGRFVGDRERVGSGGLRLFEHHVDVGAFAGLRDADDERTFEIDLRVVERVHRRSRKRHRNTRRDLDQITAKERCIIRTAASDDHDQIDIASAKEFAELRVFFAFAD